MSEFSNCGILHISDGSLQIRRTPIFADNIFWSKKDLPEISREIVNEKCYVASWRTFVRNTDRSFTDKRPLTAHVPSGFLPVF